jgi:hypothetical protein
MTIDRRYAPFDEPATFRSLLINYRPTDVSSNFLLLEKTDSAKKVEYQEMYSVKGEVGSPIEIPIVGDSFVFMHVNWKPTLLGHVVNFLYRTPVNSVLLKNINGEEREYRIIRSTAENGLFVSQFIGDADDLVQVFNGETRPDLTSVTIQSNTLFFQEDFDVTFYALPVSDLRKN